MSEASETEETVEKRRSKIRRGLLRGLMIIGAGFVVILIGVGVDQIGEYGNQWGELIIVLGQLATYAGVLVLAFYGTVWLIKVAVEAVRD